MAENPVEPQRLYATDEYAGRTCPYCRFPLKPGGELMVCGHCHSAHHADCWSDNGGCAVMGCVGGPGKSSAATQPTAAIPAQHGQAAAFVTGPAAAANASRPEASWPTPQTPRRPPPPPQQPPSSGGSGNKGLVAALCVLALAVIGVGVAVVVSKGKSGSGSNTQPLASAQVARTHSVSTPSASITTVTTTPPSTTTRTVTVSSSSSSSPTNSGSGTTPSNTGNTGTGTSATQPGDSGAQSAIETYWNDIGSGDYTDAVSMETGSEQNSTSLSTLQAEQPHINVLWAAQPAPDGSGQEIVRISFYAQNSIGNDQTCRHFVISSLMIQNGSAWLYDGHAPGTNTIDADSSGNSNCPS